MGKENYSVNDEVLGKENYSVDNEVLESQLTAQVYEPDHPTGGELRPESWQEIGSIKIRESVKTFRAEDSIR